MDTDADWFRSPTARFDAASAELNALTGLMQGLDSCAAVSLGFGGAPSPIVSSVRSTGTPRDAFRAKMMHQAAIVDLPFDFRYPPNGLQSGFCPVDLDRLPTSLRKLADRRAAVHTAIYDGAVCVSWVLSFVPADRATEMSELHKRRAAFATELIELRRRDAQALRGGGAVMVATTTGEIEWASYDASVWMNSARIAVVAEWLYTLDPRHKRGEPKKLVLDTGVVSAVPMFDSQQEQRYALRIELAAPLRMRADAALSPRVREAARYAAHGATAAEVARTMGISEETVRGYLKEAYRVLDVGSRVELNELLRE